MRFSGLTDWKTALMSGTGHPPRQPYAQTFGIEGPGTYVSQQVGAIDLTITRSVIANTLATQEKGVIHSNLINLPLTVNFSASLGSTAAGGQPSSLPASASKTFTPVNESITFPAGVKTVTASIPVNAGAANPGSVPVEISVTSSSPDVNPVWRTVYLVNGPAPLPPAPVGITNAHLIFDRKTASGISITFSQPMAPASVENVHNYAVITRARASLLATLFGPYATTESTDDGTFYSIWPVPLKAAQYDPTTNTVTLIPKKPLSASVTYTISDGNPAGKDNTLTDAQGNSLQGNPPGTGWFSFTLKGDQSRNWAPPKAATT